MSHYSLEAEQAVLGAVLLDNGAFDRIGDTLSEADFHEARHAAIWRAAFGLYRAGKPADLFTVLESLRQDGAEEEAVGGKYLNALMASVSSASSAKHYAAIVRDRAVVRSIVAAADQAQATAGEAGLTAAEKLDRATALFAELQQRSTRTKPLKADALTVSAIDRWNERFEGKATPGIRSGIAWLDRALNGGFRAGGLYILAARPSVGKSSLAQAFALQAAVRDGIGALELSQEMSAAECMDRAAANVAHVEYERLQSGKLTDEDWSRLSEATEALQSAPLWIDDQAQMSLEQIRAKAVSLRRDGLGLLVLDYLQLCDYGSARKSTNDALGEVSKGLKRLAKDLGIAVLALSQLNRKVEERASGEPEMADLRDSGAIEQDADAVLLLWTARQFDDGRRIVGLKLPKNRQGRAGGKVALEFQGAYQRWYESEASLEAPARERKGGNFE